MKQESTYSIFIQIGFMILGVLLGVISYGVYLHASPFFGVLLIVLDIMIIAGILLGVRWSSERKIAMYLDELAANIKKVSDGEQIFSIEANASKGVKMLHESIETLRKNMKQQNRTKDIVLKIANTLAVNIELEKLLNELLPKVIEGTRSNWGAFYILNQVTGKLEIKASLGFSNNVYKQFDIAIGEGFIGQAAQCKKVKIVQDIPDDTVYVSRTFIGKIKPKAMMTIPIMTQGELVGILVLASIYEYTNEQLEIVKVIRYYLGMAISNGLTYERTQRLSNELQFQNQLIQNLNDELEDKVRERTDFLNNIINSIKDYAIVSMDQDGFITTWNKGAEILKGYSANEVIGNHISVIYLESDVVSGKIERQLQIAEKEGEYVEYGWRSKKDGQKFFADVIITPMYNKNNELIGFTNITKDITVIKNMEQALLYEKTFNKKLLENSTRALLLVSQEGIIQDSNVQTEKMIGFTKEELIGKMIKDYFDHGEEVEKNLREIIRRSNRAEWKLIIRDRDNREHAVIVNANVVTDNDGVVKGVLLYLKE
jgi:PAS domain S-box-containing protein